MFDFLTNHFSSAFASFRGKAHLTEGNIKEVYEKIQQALLDADVPRIVVKTFCSEVRKEVIGQKVIGSLKPSDQFTKIIHDHLKKFLIGDGKIFLIQFPSVVLVMGLQGVGKTTSLAKIALWLKKNDAKKGKKRSILCASVDFNRPAAVNQLEIVTQRAGAAFFRATQKDSVKAAIEIYDYYKKNSFQLLLLDTAGRLHIDNTMLQELRDIDCALKPRHKILVVDSMIGQESLNVARAFEQGVGFDAALMSKVDSEASGGVAFAFRYVLKKPIAFVGTGESIDALDLFYPERAAGRILGMGDVVSLAERVQDRIKESEQQVLQNAFKAENFIFQDFLMQIEMINKLGSFSQITKLVPGMSAQSFSSEMVEQGERQMMLFKAIISSMTSKERIGSVLLDKSRKQRVARGAGVCLSDIEVLLKRFEESKRYAKLIKKFSHFSNIFS